MQIVPQILHNMNQIELQKHIKKAKGMDKGVSFKPSEKVIVVPNFCFLS